MGRLEGKVALITGTGGGQGRAAALRFAEEGAVVVGCDVNAGANEETIALVRKAGHEMTASADPKVREALLAPQLVQRTGQPQDIAELAVYLASDESGFVTGTNFVVDGGLTAL